MKQQIVIAGGSGFIGRALTGRLVSADYEVVVLSRAPSPARANVLFVQWDGRSLGEWASRIDGAAAVVNLTGRSINCRHTPENRRVILESRVDSVRVLGQAMAKARNPPAVFVQAAAIGIYGDAGDRWCDESAPPGTDFVAEVCQRWEEEFAQMVAPKTRKVLLRLGIVLGKDDGFLKVLSRLTRLFLGGQIGDGKQFISWIHQLDLTQLLQLAIELPELTGVYNAAAPCPVTNAEFMSELRHALHRPFSPPVPKFAARIGSWLMGSEASLAFVSQRARPRHLLQQDFEFEFPELRPALKNLLRT